MSCIQMMIVTGGYDGSQDVASTEVINFSGEKRKKYLTSQEQEVINFSGEKEKYLTSQEQGGEMEWRQVLGTFNFEHLY